MSLQKLKNVYFLGSLIKNIKGIYDKVNEIIDYLNGQAGEGSCKVYVALLTQSGTDAPTAIILKNTLGETPTWAYNNVGSYYLNTVDNIFTADKTVTFITPTVGNDVIDFIYQTESSIEIQTVIADTGLATDDELLNTPIEIRVYN